MGRPMPAAQPPLPLQGSYNTRELGGYPTADGRRVRRGRFLRSDGLAGLTKADWRWLAQEYGLRRIVDLRSRPEAQREPYQPPAGVRRLHRPLLDQAHSSGFLGAMPASMAELYHSLLSDSGAMLAQALRDMLAHPGGGVLFHCTAGKDRTGVVAMLLLALAGVPDEWIVADYAATEGNLAPLVQRQRTALRQAGLNPPDYLFESREESMRQTLCHLREEYGGAAGYLQAIGLDTAETAALRRQLLEGPDIREIPPGQRRALLPLLLQADPSEAMVARYIGQGELFALYVQGDPVCEALVTPLGPGVCELKNLATAPGQEGKGYAGELLHALFARYAARYDSMLVGTSEDGVGFYLPFGFEPGPVRKGFFEQYPEPVVENGRQLHDMHCLVRPLGGQTALKSLSEDGQGDSGGR